MLREQPVSLSAPKCQLSARKKLLSLVSSLSLVVVALDTLRLFDSILVTRISSLPRVDRSAVSCDLAESSFIGLYFLKLSDDYHGDLNESR